MVANSQYPKADLCWPSGYDERLESVSFRHRGRRERLETELLLVHFGVIPATQLTQVAGLVIEQEDDRATKRRRAIGERPAEVARQ